MRGGVKCVEMLGNKTAFKSLNFLNADFWVLMEFEICLRHS